jgi:hypothetical protein
MGAKAETERKRSGGVLEGADEGAVAAHRVPEDAARVGPGGEVLRDDGGQLPRDVGVHPVVDGPGPFSGVHVEAGAGAEVPVLVLAGDARVARAGVGGDQHQAVLGGEALGAALDHEGLLRARKAGQVVQDRHGPVRGLGGRVDGEAHLAIAGLRAVGVEARPAAEAGVLAVGLDGRHAFRTSRRCGWTRRGASGRRRC